MRRQRLQNILQDIPHHAVHAANAPRRQRGRPRNNPSGNIYKIQGHNNLLTKYSKNIKKIIQIYLMQMHK